MHLHIFHREYFEALHHPQVHKYTQDYSQQHLGIFSDLSGWGQYGHLFTVIIEKDKEKIQDVSSRSTEEQRDSNNKLSGK